MKQIKDTLTQLFENQKNNNSIFTPSFYRISNQADKALFEKILEIPGITVCDNILDQLREFVKLLFPWQKFSADELTNEAVLHSGNIDLEEYGVWVFYPWSKRLVHILDKDEYIRLRTSRNQNKITRQEQEILSHKKIGVIGLSVGQSVAVTLAMERICGEIRLADFDTLEVTNLNRIRTGIHNLGLHKVYSVAREIMEIDPFFIVKCFPEGVTDSNIDSFYTDGGKLDLMVEESDGFDIKIISRYKARELGIPVIMEASDRCMVDVERFDLEPERSILHGLVDHLDIAKLRSLKTTEEKIPYMLDILGLETSSTRLKASMIEIEQSINTWPQLASAVTMGGGITADVSRRMLLNQYTESGRYHIDIEELIGNKKKMDQQFKTETEIEYPQLTEEMMENAVQQLSSKSASSINMLPETLIMSWVKDAIQAPSAGNNQPWKWYASNEKIYLFHDKNKSAGWSDPFDSLAQIGLGAAIQNLKLSALHNGYITNTNYSPLQEEPLLVAELTFTKSKETLSEPNEQLYKSIDLRCTNRKKADHAPIEKNKLDALSNIVFPCAELLFMQERNEIHEIAEIVSSVEKLRFLHPIGHREFFNKEIRWNDKDAELTKDGLDIATLELSFKDQVGLKVSSDPLVIEKVREWKGGNALQKLTKDAVINSSAVALLRLVTEQKNEFLRGGEAVQRVWLAANQMGISLHPIASPLFFFDRISKLNDLPGETVQLLVDLEKRFFSIFPQDLTRKNIFLFRLHSGDAPSKRSLRRNLEDSLLIRQLRNVQIQGL